MKNASWRSSFLGVLFLFPCQGFAQNICPRYTSATFCDTLTKAESAQSHALLLTGGQLTLPFKIRKSVENNTFQLTTDVTLGAYIGLTHRFRRYDAYACTVPFSAGLSFINLNDQNTTDLDEEAAPALVPGLTWSTGIIFQLEKYNLGLLVGKDYASEVGDQWAFHNKWWWSFAIGFAFFQ